MKKTRFRIYSLFAALFIFSAATAQTSTYERTPGYYTFGINGGLSYQQSDDISTTLEGYGLGLTLGKNLYYRPGAPFAFDIRGRALYAQTEGLGYERSYGIADNDALNGTYGLDYTKTGTGTNFVFQNNKTDQVELGLEGVVSFNRLRENTNVNLSLFGGIGLDWYNVKTDQADRNGTYESQYLGIDTLGSVSYRRNELKNAILDGVYETSAHGFESKMGKIGLMPSLGVELGYQFTPRFSMGVGHKVTFTKTDLFDGQQWSNNGNLSAEEDIHHYTNLHMRWIIDDKSNEIKEPSVDITNPRLSPHTTRQPYFNVLATIKHVNSPMDVEFTVNGYNESFNFNKRDFNGNIRLRPGNNEVVIRARNAAGTASDRVNIFYQEQIITPPPPPVDNNYYPPEVFISNPPYAGFRTDIDRFDLRAEVRNITSYRDVDLTVNGRNITNFDLRNGIVSAMIDLREGNNTISISAKNSDGYDTDETTIILERAIFNYPPAVKITRPSVDPYYTEDRMVSIEAQVDGIESKGDLQYTINGYENYDFDYRNGTFYANLSASSYKSVVVITATNPDGQASDDITIIWEEEEYEEPALEKPVVTITSASQPTVDPFDPTNCKSRVVATILNVEDRDNIDVYLNGQRFNDFDFNANTQVLNTIVRLVPGTNNIRIVATNAAGRDEDQTRTEGCVIEQTETPPSVVITVPSRDNQTVSEPIATVRAEILEVKNKRDITFRLNGSSTTNFDWDASRNTLTTKVNLRPGSNIILVEARNADGRASDEVTIYYEEPMPVLPPKVSITKPVDNSKTEQQVIRFSATASNVNHKNELTLLVNGKATSNFQYQRGSLSANIQLQEGRNVIVLKAQNRDGKAQDQVNVSYEKPRPVLPPKVTITKPRNNSVSEQLTINLNATVNNISAKGELTLLVNGKSTNDFRYQRGTLDATIRLQNGKNKIVVKAQNRDGKAEDQITVTYRPKVQVPKPIVTFTNPGKATTKVRNDRFTVRAKVQHVKAKKDLIFRMNGRSMTNFQFSSKSGEFSIAVSLKEGKNDFLLEARNEAGRDDARANVTFQHMVSKKNPPSISNLTASTPTVDPFNPDKGRSRITATVKHISKKSQIKLKVNGKKTSNFSFDAGSGRVEAVIDLKKGNNTIELSASSNDGSDKATKTITFGNSSNSGKAKTSKGSSSKKTNTSTKKPPKSPRSSGSSTQPDTKEVKKGTSKGTSGSPRSRKG